MRILLIFLSVFLLINGSPLKPTPPPPGTAADKLEAFPWIKASKAKARFGPTTHAPPTTEASAAPPSEGQSGQQEIQPILTNEMLQTYIAALTAQLQPYVIKESGSPSPAVPAQPPLPPPPANIPPPLPPKKSWKAKVPKQVNPDDAPLPPTTESFLEQEKRLYPDSLYDEFYLDWLKKRQVEEIPVATPNYAEAVADGNNNPAVLPPPPAPVAPQTPPQYAMPMMSPYFANPFMYPLAGLKVSKAMAQAQVSAALAALNITTTQKPVKIKLKIPIPAGDDLASIVASGIAGFPAGTTYELSRKK